MCRVQTSSLPFRAHVFACAAVNYAIFLALTKLLAEQALGIPHDETS
jgi:hypothetical protein